MIVVDTSVWSLVPRLREAAQARRLAGTVNCLIAAQTIGQEARLLTTDADFSRIAAHCDLKLVDT